MRGDRPSWVDAFDRIPVNYSPPAAADTEPDRAAIPLARHRRRARRRRALAHVRAVALRVLVKLGARNTGIGSWLRSE
ncbi:MAG: hypothetical protein ACJ8DJ_05830 [Gemmatimonadales bacterium]